MLKIAVCDDTPTESSHLESLLKEYESQYQIPIELTVFPNGFLFLEAIEQKIPFRICFLDIYMPELNGIETARELRQRNKEMKLVFTTSSVDFALEGYKVQACNYLLKPVSKKDLFAAMDEIMREFQIEKEESLCLTTLEGVATVPFSQIVMIEANRNHCTVTCRDKRQITSAIAFGQLTEQLLSGDDFFLISRSILVNFNFVTGTKSGFLLMETGEEIGIPRRRKQEVTSAFLDYSTKKQIKKL